MATGFPVKANYATGDVLTATNMNDLSGTVNYLQYMPPRNPVLNSAFNVWQRGTSFSLAASTAYTSGFTADRWQTATNANQACTISRQSVSDSTNLPNIQYVLRYQRNSGQTGTGALLNLQNIETVNSIPYAGKQVTVSFYARKGADYSAASSALVFNLASGTGTDQNAWAGFTNQSTVGTVTATLTTTIQRFSFTATVPTTSTQLALWSSFTPTGTAGTNDYYEITGVQLELGSVANTYMPNQPTYQGELAACQRYYQRYSQTAETAQLVPNASALSTTVVDFGFPTQVTFRTKPGSLETVNVGVYQFSNGTTYSNGTWSIPNDYGNPNIPLLRYTHGSAVFTANNVCGLVSTSGSNAGYIGLSAEL